MKLQVEYVPITEIKPYRRNAKLHPQEQIEQIKNSMKEFGNIDPIGVWHDEIVEGHGRYEALKQMGVKEIPIIRLDDLTDEQRRAYSLAHNKLTMNSDFDVALLDTELAEIEAIDMTLLGFDDKEEETPQEVVEDDFDEEPPAEPIAKYGDLYQLGRHRLMCGDSTKIDDVEKLMDGYIADLLLTDPPYGIDVVGGSKPFGKVGGENIVKANTYATIIGDDTTETAKLNYEICKNLTQNQIVFGGNYFTDFLHPSRCWIVWDKQNTGNFADAELAWTSFEKSVKMYHFMWNGLMRAGDRKAEGKKRMHPTQKPVGLMADIIKDFIQDGNAVLDCFGGSGSTLIACEQMGKTCYMMELSPNYIDVIINRWEQFTGQKAVKLNAD
jgi:site-specific DNA-methyltransferase (adenine-specific)